MTPEQFDKEVFKRLNQGLSRVESFWDVNIDYEEKYGKTRYSDYNSWRISRHNRLRRKS